MAVLTNITPGLTDAFNNLPEKGSRNVWLFMVAMRARRFASQEKVRKFLYRVAEQWKNDRDFNREIDRAVRRAYASPEHTSEDHRLPTWPEFSPAAWNRRIAHPIPLSEKPLSISTEHIIDSLFPGNPILCAAPDVCSAQLLAPDLVEAIVDGREPSGLSLERLVKGVSVVWAEQREILA